MGKRKFVKQFQKICSEFHVQPVGRVGFLMRVMPKTFAIDCICPTESIEGFIDAIDALGVKIDGFTWWCFSSKDHPPCGMGGPMNEYGEGYFSEMQDEMVRLQGNESYKHYLLNEFPNSDNYRKCLFPGFWLSLSL